MCMDVHIIDRYIWVYTSTAQGGGGSFRNRKPIGEVEVVNHGWQSEATDGPTGGWGLLSFSLFLSLSLSFSLFLSLSLTIYLPTYLPIYLSTYLSTYLPIYLSIFLSFYLIYVSIYLSICLSIYLSIYVSIYLSIDLSIYLSTYLCIYLSTYLSIYRSIHLSIHLSIYLSIYLYTYLYLSISLSVYLSICKLENEAILRDFFNFWTKQSQKRNNSVRLLHFLNLTTPKTKQFCETSSIFELDDIKNKAILRDFLQKWKAECSADSLVPTRFAIFSLHLSKVLRLPRKIDARSYEVLHLSRKIILANLQIWCSKMQPLSALTS